MSIITDKDIPDSEKVFLTPEQVKEGEAIQLKMAARQYLRDTDWYAIRKADSGKDIPTDIKTKRAQARLDASEE